MLCIFIARANFSMRKDGYLNFEKGNVLHVINTRPENSNEQQWLAFRVDMKTGYNSDKSGLIPSYGNW